MALPATPSSVRLARDWVAALLREIGREDLCESAQLGVSELVTNALLHAEPPVTVAVRGTTTHPRVEVTDASLVPPRHQITALDIDIDDPMTWATMGRGLDLMARHSRRWGADIHPFGKGKVVWFEPADQPRNTASDGEIFDVVDLLPGVDDESLADGFTIQFLGMPVELFARLRVYFNEIGREVRLVAMTDPDRFPLARELAETYLKVERERRLAEGIEDLDKAIVEGRETVDLSYKVPRSAPETMTRVNSLLDQLYREFSADALLAVKPIPVLMDLQHWYVTEFARQAAGEEPRPWTGPTRLAQQDTS
jgi:anti-sigma regulatory factor (Ser/Thr protein kinase)